MIGTEFVERVDFLLKQRGETRVNIVNTLNIAKNSFNNWHTNGNIPPGNILYEIAKYLDVSMEFLLTGTESGCKTDDDITESVMKLKRLTQEQRKPVIELIKNQCDYWYDYFHK